MGGNARSGITEHNHISLNSFLRFNLHQALSKAGPTLGPEQGAWAPGVQYRKSQTTTAPDMKCFTI